MAIYYVDPDDGNDSNDGLSFANRWRTLSGRSFAGTHDIRYMGAWDRNSVGDALWTDNSYDVVLDAAKSLTIDNCDTAWTGSTNVTSTASTLTSGLANGGSMFRQGSGYARINPGSGFTTGILAYRTLPSVLDLSEYDAISFRFGSSIAMTSVQLRLDLCSDSVGAVPVASFTFEQNGSAGYVWNHLFENGAPLPSNVQSIALYAINDFGTATFGLDNIIACHSRGHPDHICHSSLIGKDTVDEPALYPIRAIDGATISIGDQWATGSGSARRRPYRGVTETVETFVQATQRPNASGDMTGLSVKNLTISGGWDRTDMSTQTANETYLSGHGRFGRGFQSVTNSQIYCSKINFSAFMGYAFNNGPGGASVVVQAEGSHLVDMATVIQQGSSYSLNFDNWQHNRFLFIPSGSNYLGDCYMAIKGNRWDGSYGDGNRGLIDGTSNGVAASTPWMMDIRFGKISNCEVGAGGGGSSGQLFIHDTVFENNGSDLATISNYGCQYYLDNCTFDPSIPVTASIGGASLRYSRRGGDYARCGFINRTFNLYAQSTTVPSGETWAWVLTRVSSYFPPDHWIRELLFSVSVKAGKTYTIDFQSRRNVTRLIGLAVLVEPDGTEHEYQNTGSVNTWQASSLSFTASEDGLADFYMGSAWPDQNSILSDVHFLGAIKITES